MAVICFGQSNMMCVLFTGEVLEITAQNFFIKENPKVLSDDHIYQHNYLTREKKKQQKKLKQFHFRTTNLGV